MCDGFENGSIVPFLLTIQLLKDCGRCSPRERYEVIMIAATAGVNPDKYIASLDGIGCKTMKECLELSSQAQAQQVMFKDDVKPKPVDSSSASRLTEFTLHLWFLLALGLKCVWF